MLRYSAFMTRQHMPHLLMLCLWRHSTGWGLSWLFVHLRKAQEDPVHTYQHSSLSSTQTSLASNRSHQQRKPQVKEQTQSPQ